MLDLIQIDRSTCLKALCRVELGCTECRVFRDLGELGVAKGDRNVLYPYASRSKHHIKT